MAEVILENICKTYGNNFHAIDQLNLSVEDGEFLILVGPSGCGKSTALRMIAGLEDITSGSLRIGGTDVVDMPPKDRDIAMVFQSYALYPHMTVFENIAFSMRLAGKPKAERKKRVDEIAKTLQLTSLLDSKPANLSGGQRQRVAMGRAMVREPAAFLMDEPLSNLDAKLRVQMRAEITSLQKQLGVTTIYVTHDQTEAMTMGDRVAVLKGGVLQQVDTPKRLYESPVNAFVAGFIGSPSMNLFEAILTGDELTSGTLAIRLQDAAFVRRPGLRSYTGRKVVFGIRPEDLYDSSLESGRKYQTIPAKVTSIEELGSEHIVHLNIDAVRVDSGDPDAVQDFGLASNAVAKFEPVSAVRAGSEIRLALDDTKLHFFDPETHLAI
ncbi:MULTISPECIES: ABC transporter ATP-binding protein [unclassified Mesorhizobium]|uniref:ABC transporter ATP-binding protein n=1 Tax=unclassified Mesorhizobium TaxID=325217 RepID=UPI000F76439B|nr:MULTISPECIES: ABC transporter ATP-binding protein [unclassified Mesorhizobium]AZO25355.1 ABC transporter ATP-binding protein [Mesorhizobium sp. M1E.F.Ca.ET.045.02.1.1]RUW30044.1 sn-glycerol-3-phosphate ABC transporter ATP-binding protein UgpC [Mesorhizobium sp. M1E.F.Ca.ET.041.01.1.1]RWB59608.1 MAG: sn-glycerol-3-phosphate ABC transporter ATP-binding protein UgpC [Mesorhizobium sp.]RWD85710.1 MAG: sn-glycerol-3-phosphate ABC transporter ATP-binding protein UgpC [Mesorhizobium sp.]RWD91483.1